MISISTWYAFCLDFAWVNGLISTVEEVIDLAL